MAPGAAAPPPEAETTDGVTIAARQPANGLPFHVDQELPSSTDGHLGSPRIGYEHIVQQVRGASEVVASLVDLGKPLSTPLTMVLAYSRYDDSDPLSNDQRERLFTTIERSPGLYLTQLSEKTEIPRSTVRYHVRILSEENMVSAVKVHGRKHLLPAGSDNPELHAALNDDARASVLLTLSRVEPASVSDIAMAIDRSPATASYHLNRLATNGLITQERNGNTVLNSLSEECSRQLAESSIPGESDMEETSRSVAPKRASTRSD